MAKTKEYSTRGALTREDSDDELGYEDLPWHWVYDGDSEPGSDAEVSSDEDSTRRRKRKASHALRDQRIAGARMGNFSVRIGETVLLKSPEQGKDWVGLICGFSDTDEDGDAEMCAHIQWFCSPEELDFGRRGRAKPDILPNEQFITSDFNLNSLSAINGKATVLSKDAYFARYPEGKPGRGKHAAIEHAKTIFCRRAVKQRTIAFSEEFVWDQIYSSEHDLSRLVDWIRNNTRGHQRHAPKAYDDDYDMQPETNEVDPETPRKKRKTTKAATHRIMIKKPLEITPLGTRILSPSAYMSSPYAHARTTLHVSAVPDSLPCRLHEFSTVYSHLHSAIIDGSGACIYISGTPGTGKTATVREVVASLTQAVYADELDDFNFVEINGMKVTEPHQSYSLLWEALKGDRVSPAHALSLLEHEFSHPSPRRIPCVVLMDELDQLVTRNQSVMYNFFNWPALRHSRLIVLAVANTMDLPERTLSNKISSRLGLTRITFPGYTHKQLMEIITSRLAGVPGDIVNRDAIQFASQKVAAVSGDARRALDICRRAVELAEEEKAAAETAQTGLTTSTPSKTNRGKRMAQLATGTETEKENQDPSPDTDPSTKSDLGRVTIRTIKTAINEATSSPIAQALRCLPLASKVLLAAVLARIRRTGVAESALGDILIEAKRIARVAEDEAINVLMGWRDVVPQTDGGGGWDLGKRMDAQRVLGMDAAVAGLVEAGVSPLKGALEAWVSARNQVASEQPR
ncbi:Origin recognition complex subunit 1 [Cyphellophora attinorum]|uniref:Origin recognition complex subunit 1 n=1 Tax=Cyphellophora attinorum TaxID=1664694 RepID=A0A0N1H7G0_9EURO|nr:Origin recognition complex subunit 1 [Phialophora attinorum]KPI38620.1 Origin recognition complex subunit 1 [Phialophora attinorum]